MTITRTDTDFGPGAYSLPPPAIPGVPAFDNNVRFSITSSNDVLVLTSDEGGPVSIDVDDGIYTGATLAVELAAKMNASDPLTGTGTITFAVSYDTDNLKFTLDATTGHTLALTGYGSTSDAADTFGFRENKAAAQSLTSDNEVVGGGTITFTFAANGNASTVEYAIYDNTTGGYIDTDGAANGASEVWATRANWKNGGAAGTVTAIGLTDFTSYTYKVKARNTEAEASAFSANSSSMYTAPEVDYSDTSTQLPREVTTGNTKLDFGAQEDSDGGATTILVENSFGAIDLTFALKNNASTASRVLIEWSEDNSTWATAVDLFTITSDNDVMRFTSDLGGPVNIDVPDGTYNTGALLATALETAMNADTTLTSTGTITFTVTFSTSTQKYTIDAGVGHTISLDFYNSDAGYTFGFTDSTTAAQTNVSTEARGENPRTLSTSIAGVDHTVLWNSYLDCGKSEHDTTVYIRITPYDVSPSGGDAGQVVTTVAFEIDNRPPAVTVVNSDGFTFDEDTTPIFQSVMSQPRGGVRLFYRLKINDYTGTLTLNKSSALSFTGWEYEDSPASWNSVTASGIDAQYADGVNRVRYTVQAGDALTQQNSTRNETTDVTTDKSYDVTMEQGELRDRG